MAREPVEGRGLSHETQNSLQTQGALYKAADGRRIKADINGAVNIGRRELGNERPKTLPELDGGMADKPAVIRRLHENQEVGSLLETGTRFCEASRVRARQFVVPRKSGVCAPFLK